MSFTAATAACPLCGAPLGGRLGAAQLPYAHPDDVGGDARHGRAWVHRRCWEAWPVREAWTRSAARLLAAQPGARAVRGVITLPVPGGVMLTDARAALAVSIPAEAIAALAAALGADRPTTLAIGHASWTIEPRARRARLAAVHGGEPFEALELDDAAAWAEVLGSTEVAGPPPA